MYDVWRWRQVGRDEVGVESRWAQPRTGGTKARRAERQQGSKARKGRSKCVQ